MAEDKIIAALRSLPLFSETFLTVRKKEGEKAPFTLNRAQLYLHDRLEEQLKATGKIRAVILKGRQQGVSTYVQLRYLHKVITTKGKYAFIMTQKSDATKNIFSMTKKFLDSLPEGLAPKPDKDSAKEIYFKPLDSGYFVGTAGSKSTGRSYTIQLMHGSEVAFWENTDEIQAGLLQTIPYANGTEILLESTANGIGGFYYDTWLGATEGKNGYQAIFLPWYWQDEYAIDLRNGDDPNLTEQEEFYLETYGKNGLTKRHLYWRRMKIAEFSNDYDAALEKFNVEYPFNAMEAFRNPVDNRFISAKTVMAVRKNVVETNSPLIIGVDPAGNGDRTAIIRRRGRCAFKLETFLGLNTMEIAGKVRHIIDHERPDHVFIDCIGIGAGVVDRLQEMGYDLVTGVNVARTANEKDKFKNLRAELWHNMREWLSQEMPVQIPDNDALMGDLTSLGYKFDSSARLQLESKDDLRKRGLPSPDTADALSLTFYNGDYAAYAGYRPVIRPAYTDGMLT